MTWVYKNPKSNEFFPSYTRKDIEDELEEVYHISDRQYDIKNIAGGKNVVIVEMVGSYSNPKNKKVYRTPLVIVLEMKNGKIKTGRHYCNPNLSYLYLTKEKIKRIFK